MRVVQILGFLFLLGFFFTLAKEKIDDVITINAEKKRPMQSVEASLDEVKLCKAHD